MKVQMKMIEMMVFKSPLKKRPDIFQCQVYDLYFLPPCHPQEIFYRIHIRDYNRKSVK